MDQGRNPDPFKLYHYPRLVEIEAAISALTEEIEDTAAAIKRANARHRRRDPDPELRARQKERKRRRRELWAGAQGGEGDRVRGRRGKPDADPDRVTEVDFRCVNGHVIDQDVNAARNLLARASGPVVPNSPPPLEDDAGEGKTDDDDVSEAAD